jgi:hypothetical protein
MSGLLNSIKLCYTAVFLDRIGDIPAVNSTFESLEHHA